MAELIGNQWLRLGAGGLLMAVIGFAAVFVSGAAGSSSSGRAVADRVSLVYSSAPGAPDNLPLTVDEAVSVGWNGSIRCHKGEGRYYRKLEGDQADPMMLLFSIDGDLIGFNLYSATEQPDPWRHLPRGKAAGIDGRELEYWDLNVYIAKAFGACKSKIYATFTTDD